ncbi:MAG: alpha/beta hydrolase [Actinobacteria bacterium]|nr:alpha/beta hydrolase [Actinomycetota bacterium]
MPLIKTIEGLEIFYKDWGAGRPVVFSHGWPLSADAWDDQLKLVAGHGFRGVAHDRRGHGRSTQTWTGHDMDHYADDLAAVIHGLDLHDVTLVGHSTGGGEVVRYLSRHGTDRIQSAVLIGAVPPLMLQTADNPEGTPLSAFDDIRRNVETDRSQFWIDLSAPFYGANREGNKISQGLRDQFWRLGMQVGLAPAYDCVKAFSETDFRAEMPGIDIPVFIAHGDDDQIVPIQAAAEQSVKLLPNAGLKVYHGAPHGIANGYEDALNVDLLSFLSTGHFPV